MCAYSKMGAPEDKLNASLDRLAKQIEDRQERLQREEWEFLKAIADKETEIMERYRREKEQWERALESDDRAEINERQRRSQRQRKHTNTENALRRPLMSKH